MGVVRRRVAASREGRESFSVAPPRGGASRVPPSSPPRRRGANLAARCSIADDAGEAAVGTTGNTPRLNQVSGARRNTLFLSPV